MQLRREQLRVQSLEKDLEQKVNARTHRTVFKKKLCNLYNVIFIFSSQAKEVKDVTELCDELLLKVQKHSF